MSALSITLLLEQNVALETNNDDPTNQQLFCKKYKSF